ncbi:uncharacterized protein LOC134287370 [Aedes albopictus]|uniref:Uncharacterized protein n=1 Tax=Aedes albopictus TaxID=7160 RepID=A0ABM1YTX7_AEDAL
MSRKNSKRSAPADQQRIEVDANKKSQANNGSTEGTSAAALTVGMIELELDYLQKERSIKLKAIADREAVELAVARKSYCLMKSRLQLQNGCDGNSFDDADPGRMNVNDSADEMSIPDAFEYIPSTSSSPTRNLPMTSKCLPTPQQVSARQVMPMDLPIFAGDPEEWPVFYSQFKNTTAACGYNNSENLVRLQRCLRGQALEYVRSRLLLPELVPKVINTLEMLYGKPTVIINSLVNKVRSMPPPEMERLDTIIDYGMAIQNLFDHMKAMNQLEHLRNPTLLQELEIKLPSEMKLQWAKYKRQNSPSSLKTLNDFMIEIVEVACEVFTTGSKARTDREQNDEICETDSIVGSQNSYCFICRERSHRVQDCAQFQSLDVSHRWRLIGELKLCRCCLGRHATRVCQQAYECGTDRCQLLHHPLLHQVRN